MPTRKIAPSDWKPTLDSLSRVYHGALVSLEILSREFGDQPHFYDLPLNGVSVDRSEIAFQVLKNRDHVTHRVPSATTLWIHEREDGAVAALEVLGADGSGTLMTFKSPIRADILDRAVE